MLFPDQTVNYSSAGPGAHHLQNTDFTPSSYFVNMNILEEMSTKRKFMILDGKSHPDVSSILSGNNHYYDRDNFSVGRQAEYEKINKVLFSNPRQPYFQQKESSFFHETYQEEVSNLRYIDHCGYAKQSDPSGFHSEYSSNLLRTFLPSQDKQKHSMSIPSSSSYEEACLEKEKLNNSACTSKELESIYLGKQDEATIDPNNRTLVERSLCVNSSLSSERLTEIGDGFSANMDEQNKATNRKLSPVISEKIWDGSLKLNTSTTVSVVAFFKRFPMSTLSSHTCFVLCYFATYIVTLIYK